MTYASQQPYETEGRDAIEMYFSASMQWHPTPVLLPGKSHGWRSLVGCSPWSRWVGHNWVTSLSVFTFTHRRRQWQPTPVFLPGESQGQRSLVGCSPWRRYELNTTERLYFHFSLSCTGEGNGNPLQYSCLENPRDGGAWWAAVYGVAQSWTRLKWLSSSSRFQRKEKLFSRVRGIWQSFVEKVTF